MSAVTEPNAPGVTVLDAPNTAPTNGTASAVAAKKGSGKSKAELGIPEDWKITWPPIAFPSDEHVRLTKVAKYRNDKQPEGAKLYGIDQLMIEMAHYGINAHKETFDHQAAEWDKNPKATVSKAKVPIDFATMTPEAAEAAVAKEMAGAQKRYNDAQALLARMRAAAAAGTIGTAIQASAEPEGTDGDEAENEDDD